MPAPYFCYNNLLRGVTVVSEATLANFTLVKGTDGRTSSQVGMASGATRDIIVDFASAQTFTHFALANHNLSGTTVTLAGSSDNSTYTTVATISVANNYVQTHEFASATYRYLRLRFADHTANIYASDIFVGTALALPYGLPFGFVPPEQSDQDAIDVNMTGNGAIAGISVTRKPRQCKVQMQDYDSSWFESNWAAFVASLKLYPAYFLWAPAKRAMYFVIDGKVGDLPYTNHTRQSITLSIEGFVE